MLKEKNVCITHQHLDIYFLHPQDHTYMSHTLLSLEASLSAVCYVLMSHMGFPLLSLTLRNARSAGKRGQFPIPRTWPPALNVQENIPEMNSRPDGRLPFFAVSDNQSCYTGPHIMIIFCYYFIFFFSFICAKANGPKEAHSPKTVLLTKFHFH